MTCSALFTLRGLFGLVALNLTACSQGATTDPALAANMRIQGAQFVPGMPPSAAGGPNVDSIELVTSTIWPGYWNKLVRGALDPVATAVTLSLAGDRGYWLVRAGVPDISAPRLPTYRATASFSANLAAGNYTLEARAVDSSGNFGEASALTLTALSAPPARPAPAGVLVVSLSWDSEADLDLHVVDALGTEIFHGDPSSEDGFAPGGSSMGASAGVLDLDSNADCNIDGLRREDVVWSDAPPAGHYLVRVDTNSLCDRPNAHWRVSATLNGVRLGETAGFALDSDTWGPHDRGAGVLALSFDVP